VIDVALIAAGVVLLYGGGELLVRGAVGLARRFGLSPMVIGLTVVAFGTSSPELAATLAASLRGSPEVALGNVVGSNIANLGLILGASALVFPLAARGRFVRREVPFMILVSALLLPLGFDGVYGRLEGLLLLALLALYLRVLLRAKEPVEVVEEFREEFGDGRPPAWRAWVEVAAGLVLLVAGARLLVDGAVSLARGLGVPETVIGLTLVALGTSLPELASCLVAAFRKEGDIVLGNLIGSNVFNVLAILGTAALVRPLALPFAALRSDFWVMIGFSVAIVPVLALRGRIGRLAGGALLAAYAGYVGYLYR
jgi:cation:H+ antiporter